MELPVVVFVSDKYLWALGPFCYLFNTFWSSLQTVTVVGFSKPEFYLPGNFQFYSVAPQNYPPEHWSDAAIAYFSRATFQHFVWLLEDYWICRTVDLRGVVACHEYVRNKPEVLRIDLTADRLYAGGMYDVDYWGSYDIIETPPNTPYQMSLQAGIWNRERLLEILQPNKSAWDIEIHTQVPSHMRVLGTRQMPIRYANGIWKGKLDLQEVQKIPLEHRVHIQQWYPKDIEVRKA